MKRKIYSCIWRISEKLGLRLGRFDAYVFDRMMGVKPNLKCGRFVGKGYCYTSIISVM
jgi:hypothetical protein